MDMRKRQVDMDAFQELIEKAKVDMKEADDVFHQGKTMTAWNEFVKHFHMEPDKVVWIEKLGAVIETGDIRLAWHGSSDGWSMTAICEDCGQEFDSPYGTWDLAHLEPPSRHMGCPSAPKEKECPFMKLSCIRDNCAIWNPVYGSCAIQAISTATE